MEQDYKYMVCTSCMTYNHAPYIKDALNGFKIQETTFPVVYLITDDASTDGEQEVIRQYLAEHFQYPYRVEETDDYNLICAIHKSNPNCIFIVFLLKYNHYVLKKSKLLYQTEWRNNAKYIATCEGDDYWIHPQKLQLQINYLESHSNCGLVYCKAVCLNNNKYGTILGKRCDNIEDLIYQNTIPTLTTIYKQSLREGFESLRLQEWKMGDYPLWLYLSSKSEIHFIDEVMAVYRVLDESASHSCDYLRQTAFKESTFRIQLYFSEKFKIGDKSEIEQRYYYERFDYAFHNLRQEDLKLYFKKLKHKNFKIRLKYLVGINKFFYIWYLRKRN